MNDVEKARKLENDRKGKFDSKIYLIDVKQDYADEREEYELNKRMEKKSWLIQNLILENR